MYLAAYSQFVYKDVDCFAMNNNTVCQADKVHDDKLFSPFKC